MLSVTSARDASHSGSVLKGRPCHIPPSTLKATFIDRSLVVSWTPLLPARRLLRQSHYKELNEELSR